MSEDCKDKSAKAPIRTIAGLRLDLKSAEDGKTWLLLPDGFRDGASGTTYPLPSGRHELQRLAMIAIPPRKTDSGCVYLRRAIKDWKRRQLRRNSALLNVEHQETMAIDAQDNFKATLRNMRNELREAVSGVKKEAEQAIASLTDLFSLGRKGLEGQMKAHLAGEPWQGEEITASAFRDCFRMVTQAVKGLGLPSEQRERATQVVMEEAAAAIRSTQEAVQTVALVPDSEETEH